MTLMSHDLFFKAQPVRERLKDNYKLHSVILSYPCCNTNKMTSEITFCLSCSTLCDAHLSQMCNVQARNTSGGTTTTTKAR